MRRDVARSAILFASFVVACNAISGASDLGICDSDPCTTEVVSEAGSVDTSAPDGGPTKDSASPPDAAVAMPFGTGRSGGLTVAAGMSMVVNTYAAIGADVKSGDTVVPLENITGFASGDLVLVWQAAGLAGVVSGGPPVVLGASSVGHYELARVMTVGPSSLVLVTPLGLPYPAFGSQVVRLPEYTDVTIPAGSKISAAAWDGSKGGVVAFLASGTVTVDGQIAADSLGFRGGVGFITPNSLGGCTSLDGTPVTGYAAKGEGIALGGYSSSNDGGAIGGRGNRANGAGGGVCHNGAGGGGGHGGAGGAGAAGNGMGGLGGAALQYTPLLGLLMGAGGAAGDANGDIPLPHGGAGGGAVFMRARTIVGAGTIASRGANGVIPSTNDGAGGGGAGGGILIVSEKLQGVSLRAEGGAGGSGGANAGGGGGAGGVIDVSTTTFQSNAVVTGGDGGSAAALAGGGGAIGRVDILDGGP